MEDRGGLVVEHVRGRPGRRSDEHDDAEVYRDASKRGPSISIVPANAAAEQDSTTCAMSDEHCKERLPAIWSYAKWRARVARVTERGRRQCGIRKHRKAGRERRRFGFPRGRIGAQ